jgi:hypothetical protein
MGETFISLKKQNRAETRRRGDAEQNQVILKASQKEIDVSPTIPIPLISPRLRVSA